MNLNKKMPVWLMIPMDILLVAVIVLTFAYFHHVRDFNGEEGPPIEKFSESTKENFDHVISHDWQVKKVVAPTCLDGGYTEYICSCGSEKTDDYKPATGHGDFYFVGKKGATQTETGYTGDKYCGYCGALIAKGMETPAGEHADVVLINVVESTCSEEGYSGDWYCNDCQKIVAKGAATEKKPHTLDAGEVIAPTCTTEGYTLRKCLICGEEVKENITAIVPHTPDDNGVCTMCGELILDKSGDFGALFPEKFLQKNEKTVFLKDDEEIRIYAKDHGLKLNSEEGSTYITLYRSHDVYLTVRQVQTVMYKKSGEAMRAKYFDYDVYVRNIENLFTCYASKRSFESMLNKAEDYSGNPVLGAINGDYISNKNHCRVAVRNGELVRTADSILSDICVLYYDGTMEVYAPEDYNWETVTRKPVYQIWDFGPSLIDKDGNAIQKYDGSAFDSNVTGGAHPRSAIGYYSPGHYCLLMTEGRKHEYKGFFLYQLADLMHSFGCTVAYNFDGGDSAQAFLDGERIRGATRDEQRKLTDIICVGEYTSKEESSE